MSESVSSDEFIDFTERERRGKGEGGWGNREREVREEGEGGRGERDRKRGDRQLPRLHRSHIL